MGSKKAITVSNKEGVHALIMACHEFGVHDVIISPGSRNAPLTISFNQSGLFRCHSIADERSAGFYALGMSLGSSKPVAVVCTSGSAALNLAPALAEAFYVKAPVIAITADRPLAWTDQGNGQTIRQEAIFKNYTRDWYSLYSEPASRDEIWMNRRRLSELFNKAIYSEKGPIHINVPLSEPLYGTKSYPPNAASPFYKKLNLIELPTEDSLQELSARLNDYKKVMILVGQSNSNQELQEAIAKLGDRDNVVVLTETTSNLNFEIAIDTIDRIIMSIQNDQLVQETLPELLITCGGLIVSKKIKSLLREYQPKEHWHIDEYDQSLDTFQSLSLEINADPALFLNKIFDRSSNISSDYKDLWAKLKQISADAHAEYIADIPYSDFEIFKEISACIPEDISVHLANSTPVRYAQLFGFWKNTIYYGNRGTSGIDGSTSTAAGIALKKPDDKHLLITGDTAFIYDSNALWNREFPGNLKIIVINNSGGGIFRIIEGPDRTEELEEFFETHHPVNIKKLVESFSFKHFFATDSKSLKEMMQSFFSSNDSAVLEVQTNAEDNPMVLKKYFRFIQKKIEKELNLLIKK